MFCKYCGANIEDAHFCNKCGKNIEVGQKDQNEAEESVENQNVEVLEKLTQEKKPLRKKLFITTAVAVLVIMAMAILVSTLIKPDDDFYSTINFNNGGRFAYDSKNLYIIGLFNESDDESTLYVTDYNGKNKKQISKREDITRIRLEKNKIYYYSVGDDVYTIGCMNKKGKNDKTIISLEKSVSSFDVSGGKLYYLSDSKLNQCSLNGEDNKILIEGIDDFVVDGKTVYYEVDDDVYAYNLKKRSKEKLVDSENVSSLALKGNQLYFKSEKGLMCLNVKTNEASTVIKEDNLSSYVFYKDKIYYKDMWESKTLDTLAKMQAGGDSNNVVIYKILLAGCGPIKSAPTSGGDGDYLENIGASVFELYVCPNGIYQRLSLVSQEISKSEID